MPRFSFSLLTGILRDRKLFEEKAASPHDVAVSTGRTAPHGSNAHNMPSLEDLRTTDLDASMLSSTTTKMCVDFFLTKARTAKWYVISGSMFPLLNQIWRPETCLGSIHSLDVFQSWLYALKQARLAPKSLSRLTNIKSRPHTSF